MKRVDIAQRRDPIEILRPQEPGYGKNILIYFTQILEKVENIGSEDN